MSKTDDVIAGLENVRKYPASMGWTAETERLTAAITHIREQDARIKAMQLAIEEAVELIDGSMEQAKLRGHLAPFLPKPDPLAEVLDKFWKSPFPDSADRCAADLRAALADRGLVIVENGEG